MQNTFFLCTEPNCSQQTIFNEWEEVINHVSFGHKVLDLNTFQKILEGKIKFGRDYFFKKTINFLRQTCSQQYEQIQQSIDLSFQTLQQKINQLQSILESLDFNVVINPSLIIQQNIQQLFHTNILYLEQQEIYYNQYQQLINLTYNDLYQSIQINLKNTQEYIEQSYSKLVQEISNGYDCSISNLQLVPKQKVETMNKIKEMEQNVKKYDKNFTQRTNFHLQSQMMGNRIIQYQQNNQQQIIPLKGYKQREEQLQMIQLLRSNRKKLYLDDEQLIQLKLNTIKKFDSKRSAKNNIIYYNEFSKIFSEKDNYAITEEQFQLTQNQQIHFYLESNTNQYEIAAGIVNYTQVMNNRKNPDFYGLNKEGVIVPGRIETKLKLRSNYYYILAYRQDLKQLILINEQKKIQISIQLPFEDNQSYFAFFVRICNINVTLL